MERNEPEHLPVVSETSDGEVTSVARTAVAGPRTLALASVAAQHGSRPTGANARTAALVRALQRLEGIIDEEITALQERREVDFDSFAQRKNRGLLELVRSSRVAGDGQHEPAVAAEVLRLRAKLEKNYNVLRVHFEAVRAVSEIICRTIRDAESDGTYRATPVRRD
jgi:hypothetical protein